MLGVAGVFETGENNSCAVVSIFDVAFLFGSSAEKVRTDTFFAPRITIVSIFIVFMMMKGERIAHRSWMFQGSM